MTRKYLVIVGIVVGVLGAAVLAGMSGSGRGPARWEYGVFRGEGVWTWYGPGEAVDNGDASDFANRIGAACSQRGDQLEANVLNGLAARGWEVVGHPRAEQVRAPAAEVGPRRRHVRASVDTWDRPLYDAAAVACVGPSAGENVPMQAWNTASLTAYQAR